MDAIHIAMRMNKQDDYAIINYKYVASVSVRIGALF